MTDWFVGQKVVCIDADISFADEFLIKRGRLTKGQVYTIRAIQTCVLGSFGFRLQEITCSMRDPRWEYGFLASRFRPAVERKTNISLFHRMLTPSRIEEPVS